MMSNLSFAAFYAAVHGRPPFPWQDRLATLVLNGGEWPSGIAVPTGCGKTSVIDIAVFALASQAGRPAMERTAPLRIFFVVDRRLVVDDVTAHALQIACAVNSAQAGPLAEVRASLLRFGGAKALEVATLRGGMYRNDGWADAPNQPLVCVSTVDQTGSRLLFRGYGVSASRSPQHASLAGNDALILVDEAHLSKPFLDTLARIRSYQEETWVERRVAPGLRVVEMSATVRASNGAFTLDREDDYSERLAPRLEARKLAELKEVADIEKAAAHEAVRLADSGSGVVGVVLNTVASARAIFSKIEGEKLLLTGRVRPYDRDLLLARYSDRIAAGRERREGERLFVVATQTVEVGADLDFDALVTEAAPLDSLRQRFGRLNRLGNTTLAHAVVLKRRKAKGHDWLYGEALENTWKWLNEHATAQQGRAIIDFGVRAMTELFSTRGSPALNTQAHDGPLMFPAHLDVWVQTDPKPASDPDVAPFLHGPQALQAEDVQIVWRADIEDEEDPRRWAEIVAAAPPVSTEALSLPIGAARRWLKGTTDAEVADVEGAADQAEDREPGEPRPLLIWRGPGRSETGLRALRPGDTVIVRSSEGGVDEFGWAPDSRRAVTDIGDACAAARTRAAGGRYRLRIHPAVLFPDGPEKRRELAKLLNHAQEEGGASEELKSVAADAAVGVGIDPELLDWRRVRGYAGDRGLVVLSRWSGGGGDADLDETDEEDTSSFVEKEITLSAHAEGVVAKTRQFAAGCGLSEALAADLAIAARLHDIGKSDKRFQALLDPRRRDPDGELLAKGKPCDSRAEFRRRRDRAGYPEGARHEFVSVAIAAAARSWTACDRDLVLYLIGTHHGYGRPFPPVWLDPENPEICALVDGEAAFARSAHELARLDSGWPDRFWSLTRRYGWWGLAYLETILRRADCVRSREEQEQSR
jgi:CRISPR-associated endonuclease/helicase Cas3